MEHASTGAGADHNPVKRCMTNVLSCPRVLSQHFWDGLRKKKKKHMKNKHFISKSSITCDWGKRNKQPGVAWIHILFAIQTSQKKKLRWISCPWCSAVPPPACGMRWPVPSLQRADSRCDVGGCRWGQPRCWKEYIRARDYWAENGKPGGGNISWSHTNGGSGGRDESKLNRAKT